MRRRRYRRHWSALRPTGMAGPQSALPGRMQCAKSVIMANGCQTDRKAIRVVLPIRVGLDEMESLFFANFEGDPEFEGIEPQVFHDAVNGNGMRVLRYRRDGKVDVYWQPGVRVNRSTFAIGAGIGDFAETTIEPAHLAITDRSVDVRVAFTDEQGRKVELRTHEERRGERGFPLLAPVGADIERPTQLFLVYMPRFDLVRRTGSQVAARIGDRTLRPASLPILLDGHRVWFVRHAADPVIGTLNRQTKQPVVIELPVPGEIDVDGMSVVVDGHGSVTRISAGKEFRRVEMDFEPGFPNLLEVTVGVSALGRWSFRLAGVPITGGSYGVSRSGDRAAVALDVTEPWKPSGLPLSMRILTRVVPKFRMWPTTYRWRGVVELGTGPTMSGTWERVRAS